jgi:hypothetical protein
MMTFLTGLRTPLVTFGIAPWALVLTLYIAALSISWAV